MMITVAPLCGFHLIDTSSYRLHERAGDLPMPHYTAAVTPMAVRRGYGLPLRKPAGIVGDVVG
jgi:hypothetical protein